MRRSTLAVFLASTIISASLLAYGVTASSFAESGKAGSAKADTSEKDVKDYVVIRYGDKEIHRDELEKLWKTMFPGEAPSFSSFDTNVQLEILRNIARESMILDKAYAAKIEESEEVKSQMENLKRQLVIQAYFKSILDELVPEAEVRKEYDRLAEQVKGQEEVHARHILVETEEAAEEIVDTLKEGADFAKLAKEKSSDTGSGAQGGDLGYFTKDRMVPEFAEAAFKLKKGEVSDPVKSDFGWHVIKLEDRRPISPPSFEEVKEQLQARIANTAIEKYTRNLLDSADVKFYNQDGTELRDTYGDNPDDGED